MKSFLLLLVFTAMAASIFAAEPPAALPLWPHGAPGSEPRVAEAEKTDGNNPQPVRRALPSTDAADPIERASSRPDFQALIYPGTSNLFTVEKGMPPVFIACGYGDRPDIAEGMASLYLNYKAAGVKAELHIYANAGHGFGYRPGTTSAAGAWPFRFREWLVDSRLLD